MNYDGVLLFSGGLDSLLAGHLLQSQGLRILCVHYWTPFFGSPDKIPWWRKTHGLDIMGIDASLPFVRMLAEGPEDGFGKNLNPCIDCKILLLRLARTLLDEVGASFLATGEVIGQRPMSQRRDSLHRIQNRAGVAGLVLRPLSALLLEPVQCEIDGIVNRELLLGISGRGRDEQLRLAEKFQLKDIPAPAGGCLLTEKENTRRFWHILERFRQSGDRNYARLSGDFSLCKMGRQYFKNDCWLCVGRNAKDNAALKNAALAEDALFRVRNFPGPLSLARGGAAWPETMLAEACAITASHSPKAAKSGNPVTVAIETNSKKREFIVEPGEKPGGWGVPMWEETRQKLQALRKRP